ncbi:MULTISPECIES: GntR family transcriptional regulator [unclassified Simplicispira]|uniref:GntR family transcriptional regulator n=1 Tax=unclassified Simplicispira TaxID=2630407 RepID=UPI000D5F8DB9|nr:MULTISPECIES: GntR family transcriptional regulator [unclassified Simplicispira]PVY55841.1 GntR family transcriptional regulator [Simplicispira sp. 125]REG16784.1 GntR family transcriptional regulator [Simplicispira sp. 110]
MLVASLTPTPTGISKMRATTVAEQIAEYLGAQMLAGALKPGEAIVEHKVAEIFGISRGPVRDALRILERQGLVRIEPRRGASVVKLTLNDIIDLFNARAMLLSLAVRYQAISGDPARMRTLEGPLQDARNGVDSDAVSAEAFVHLIGRLGLALLKATPSKPIIDAFNNLSHQTVWSRIWKDSSFFYESSAGRQETCESFGKVFNAIEAEDPDAAALHMEKFSALIRNEMVRRIQPMRAEPVDEFRLRCF